MSSKCNNKDRSGVNRRNCDERIKNDRKRMVVEVVAVVESSSSSSSLLLLLLLLSLVIFVVVDSNRNDCFSWRSIYRLLIYYYDCLQNEMNNKKIMVLLCCVCCCVSHLEGRADGRTDRNIQDGQMHGRLSLSSARLTDFWFCLFFYHTRYDDDSFKTRPKKKQRNK